MRPPTPRSRPPIRPADPRGRDGRAPLLGEKRSLCSAMAPAGSPSLASLPSRGWRSAGSRSHSAAQPQVPWGSGVGQGWAPLPAAALPFSSFTSDKFATRRRKVRGERGRVLFLSARESPALSPRLLLFEGLCVLLALGSVWKGPPDHSLLREVLCSPRHRYLAAREGFSRRAEEMVCRVEWLIPSFLPLLSKLIYQLCEEKKRKNQ